MYFIIILLLIIISVLIIWMHKLRAKVSTLALQQAKVVESDQRFRLLLQNIPNVSVQGYDHARRVNFWNEASETLYGYRREEAIGQLLEDLIIPESMREIVVKSTDDWLSGGAAIPAGELELKTKSGQLVHVYSSHVMSHDDHGNPEMYCIDIDLTRHKQGEQYRILAATVFQHSSEGMMTTDADRKIVAINPAFTYITGYSEDDILGQQSLMLMSNKQEPYFYDELKAELDREGEWQGEIWGRRKDGSSFLAWLTVNTIFNDDSSVYQRVALFSDITEKKEAETLALKKANYDDLTSLPNRNMFHDRLEQEIKKSNRSNKPLAVFFLDLDKFKEVNDTFGHQVGDRLLVGAAKRITDCVRDADTVARLGGDEFTVILTDLDDILGIERIANNIIESLSQPFQLGIDTAYVSASIGITLYPNDAHDVGGLLKNADQAMYMAKDAGRGCFRYFTKKMQQSAWERFNLLNDLRVALVKDQLELYYQPIIHLKTGKVHKAEALLRWNHPERGMVSPADFIPLAEESGLIIEIGRWVFLQAIQQIKLCQKFDPEFQISINKSPIQFREKSDVLSVMKQYEVAGNNIVIEIMESLLMENKDIVAEKLLNYRDAGIQVALDDFGTGYSSLAYLNKFDIDYLKIDQSFIQHLTPNSNELTLSEAIIVMAHKLGIEVIAEGVETEQQRDLLLTADCDYVQGYLYSKPLPVAQFEQFLIRIYAQ